jgi:protoporphyrinogen oxidase
MRVAIIGAGFTGLAAASDLVRAGATVTIFEAAAQPGGLAAGFTTPEWKWTIEKHYHHLFTTDTSVRNWLKELGLFGGLKYKRVKTATRFQGTSRSLDSAMSLLSYTPLSFFARVRLGFGLAVLKVWPFGRWLDRFTAMNWIQTVMGHEAWRVVWEPLFSGKFGKFAPKINAAWFWARIKARSAALGIYRGGFALLAEQVVDWLKQKGVRVQLDTAVVGLRQSGESWHVKTANGIEIFDQVLLAAESQIVNKLLARTVSKTNEPKIHNWYKKLSQLEGLGAQTLVIELDKPFFADGTYWLNINEPNWPFLAVVEQTQLTGTAGFNGHHILYVGKYLEPTTDEFNLTEAELWKKYLPFLQQLSPAFEQHVIKKWLFKAWFAQPLVFVDHHKRVPSLKTPWQNLFWASMQHVYPWDRGINFAVQIGRAAASALATAAK